MVILESGRDYAAVCQAVNNGKADIKLTSEDDAGCWAMPPNRKFCQRHYPQAYIMHMRVQPRFD